MSEDAEKPAFKWRRPQEVMQLHQLKKKKRALQARMNTSQQPGSPSQSNVLNQSFGTSNKRKNPFVTSSSDKRVKPDDVELSESTDQTLFKLLHFTTPPKGKENAVTSFENILSRIEAPACRGGGEVIKVLGESWIPVDWCLKTKLRLLSSKPIPWNQKLRISEEASGVTSFARCLETDSSTSSLDTSPNAKFHQCCLYWQQPSLPWLPLFPRLSAKATQGITSVATTSAIKDSLRIAWSDGLRSLFQLIRTGQCPYFYACAGHFTALFRAAGVGGFAEMHALVTPTTRGLRNALRQEEIEFGMPLKRKRDSDAAAIETPETKDEHEEDDGLDEEWMESMGINSEDIKQINYTQAKINQRNECEVDNSEESLILVEGHEVQGLYSFLANCKSAIPTTGPYAGVPPTLLAPVAFYGATLSALRVRESKVHTDDGDFYSLDVSGPILPHAVHNMCAIYPKENSMTVSFSPYNPTVPLSRVTCRKDGSGDGVSVFREENLRDCGLTPGVLRQFCSDDPRVVCNVDCLKYTAETGTYAWT